MRLLFDLGNAEGMRNSAEAIVHLREAHRLATDPVERARAAEAAGRTMTFTEVAPEATAAFLREAIAEIGDTDDPELLDLRDALIADRQATWFFGSRDDEAEQQMIDGRHRDFGPSPGGRMRSAMVAAYWTFAGGSADECCSRALEALWGDDLVERSDGLYAVIATLPLGAAVRDEALTMYDRLLGDAYRRGSMWSVLANGMWRGWVLLLRGDLEAADESLRGATEGARTWGLGDAMPGPVAYQAQVLLARGEVDAVRKALSLGTPMNASHSTQLWLCARGELELLEGRFDDALATAEEAGGGLPRQHNPAFAPWLSLKARALARLGRTDDALAAAEEELGHARAWGAPAIVGRGLRVVGEIADDEERLREAVEALAGSPAKLEYARALAALGSTLRRARRPSDAREPLRSALELADHCGATALADHVRSELRASGARPRAEALTGVGSLTASERRVADLAVDGRTNRDIAQELFVTPKTVEVHLSNAYRKLGIRSRRELSGALGDERAGDDARRPGAAPAHSG